MMGRRRRGPPAWAGEEGRIIATKKKEDHADLALRLWEAVADGDGDRVRELLAPDVSWFAPGDHLISGEFHGVEAVIGAIALVGEQAEHLQSSLEDVFVSERGAVLRIHSRGRRGERTMDTDHLMLVEIERGRITRMSAIPVDYAAHDAFWAR